LTGGSKPRDFIEGDVMMARADHDHHHALILGLGGHANLEEPVLSGSTRFQP
jgi:hypothetical protein